MYRKRRQSSDPTTLFLNQPSGILTNSKNGNPYRPDINDGIKKNSKPHIAPATKSIDFFIG